MSQSQSQLDTGSASAQCLSHSYPNWLWQNTEVRFTASQITHPRNEMREAQTCLTCTYLQYSCVLTQLTAYLCPCSNSTKLEEQKSRNHSHLLLALRSDLELLQLQGCKKFAEQIATKRRKNNPQCHFATLTSGKMQLPILVNVFPISLLNINVQLVLYIARFASEVQGHAATRPQKRAYKQRSLKHSQARYIQVFSRIIQNYHLFIFHLKLFLLCIGEVGEWIQLTYEGPCQTKLSCHFFICNFAIKF